MVRMYIIFNPENQGHALAWQTGLQMVLWLLCCLLTSEHLNNMMEGLPITQHDILQLYHGQ